MKVVLLLLSVGCLLLSGCATTDMAGDVYSRDHARTVHNVKVGKIIALKAVRIEGTKSGVGAVSGAALGTAIGNTIGSGSGKTVGQVGGAVAGTYLGSKVEEAISSQKAWEIIVELTDGEVLSVVQGATEKWTVGETVRVLEGPSKTTRVTKF